MALVEQAGFAVCGEAADGAAALEILDSTEPDVALVDITLPGIDGIELTKLMLARRATLNVLVISVHDESIYALRALRAGAKGYAKKDEPAAHLVDAIEHVLAGGIYLSPELSRRLIFKAVDSMKDGSESLIDNLSDRELEVVQLLGKGLRTREIADKLKLSVKTIETHRSHINKKLGLKSARETVKFATDWVAQG